MKKYSFSLTKNPGLMTIVNYFTLLLVNALVIAVANLLFPQQIVLGTMTISPVWAVLHSMGVLALIGTFMIPVMHEIERWKGQTLTPQEWMLGYLVVNFVGLWGVSRFAEQFGLGISAWYVVLAVALVLDLVQGVMMMQLEKWRVAHS